MTINTSLNSDLNMSEIAEQPAFQRLACVLRAAQMTGFAQDMTGAHSPDGYQMRHLAQEFYAVQQRLLAVERANTTTARGRARVADDIRMLFTLLAQTGYLGWAVSAEDVAWFRGLITAASPADAWGLRAMLLAFGTSIDVLLTPVDAALLTDEGESTWRKRILAGEVPGVIKRGKQWLIQAAAIRVLGYEVPPWDELRLRLRQLRRRYATDAEDGPDFAPEEPEGELGDE